MAAAIRVAGLRKHYGGLEALKGVDFQVTEGECFALLGPNGAGKTTAVEILEGYRTRSAGEVEVLGFDPEVGGRDFRERIGIVLQSCGIHRDLTVDEVVTLFGGYYPHPRATGEVIELVGLDDKRSARTKTLSGGQLRRLDLALGIVGDPDLVFLDEPTTGFDPSARRRAWELVASLRALGKTILLTTHYMEEAQELADRVAVLAGGAVVASGSPSSLGGRDLDVAHISFRLPAGLTGADLPGELPGTPEVRDGRVSLRTTAPTRALHALSGWAMARGHELEALAVARPTLEDVYLRLTTTGEGDAPAGNGGRQPLRRGPAQNEAGGG
jgi:ABC-type multidrug transport system ATPase subunit